MQHLIEVESARLDGVKLHELGVGNPRAPLPLYETLVVKYCGRRGLASEIRVLSPPSRKSLG